MTVNGWPRPSGRDLAGRSMLRAPGRADASPRTGTFHQTWLSTRHVLARRICPARRTVYGSLTVGVQPSPGQSLLIRGGTSSIGMAIAVLGQAPGPARLRDDEKGAGPPATAGLGVTTFRSMMAPSPPGSAASSPTVSTGGRAGRGQRLKDTLQSV